MQGLNRTYLPITLDITDKQILVVGNDEGAEKKIRILKRFTDAITQLSNKEVVPFDSSVELIVAEYESFDYSPYYLVYASTDDLEEDKVILEKASKQAKLTNVHDRPDLCEFISPAVYQGDNLTVAIGTNGTNALKAIRVRNEIKQFLENKSE